MLKSKALSIGAILVAINLPAHACNIPKSYYKHVSCTASSRYFLAVKDSGQPVALIGKNGKPVADLTRYSQVDVSKLSEGLLPVQRAGKVGYVSATSGREVIPAVYDVIINDAQTSGWARAAKNNRIVVKKGGNFGIISTSNRIILPFSANYKSISDYSSGIAKIVKTNETIWVDSNARRTANPDAKPVQATAKPASNKTSSTTDNQANSKGDVPAPISTVSDEVWQPKQRDGKWGFVNSAGVAMITFSFDDVAEFSEGLAAVRIGDNWGFVNLKGSLIIPFRFDDAGIIRDNNATYQGVPPLIFTDGKAWIGNLNDGTKLCIDKEGINVPCDGSISIKVKSEDIPMDDIQNNNVGDINSDVKAQPPVIDTEEDINKN